ncbi:MAG: hypothetical protein ACTS6G_03930 [Candidatus Hodgkinia cicadicola]
MIKPYFPREASANPHNNTAKSSAKSKEDVIRPFWAPLSSIKRNLPSRNFAQKERRIPFANYR